jgi:hypothetical protein
MMPQAINLTLASETCRENEQKKGPEGYFVARMVTATRRWMHATATQLHAQKL